MPEDAAAYSGSQLIFTLEKTKNIRIQNLRIRIRIGISKFRNQKPEYRNQKSESQNQNSEIRNPEYRNFGIKNQKSEFQKPTGYTISDH